MKRSQFIKSLVTIFAAPALIKDIGVSSSHTLPVLLEKKKKAIYFKFSSEMVEDKQYLNHFIEQAFINGKFNIDNDWDYKIVYAEDDFTKNLLTCIIYQYE